MKKAKRLKLLIDIFSAVFIVVLIVMIVNAVSFYSDAYKWNGTNRFNTFSLNGFFINHALLIIKNIILIIGVLYLRKVIKAILIKNYFSVEVTKNLKKTGLTFFFTGAISLILVVLLALNAIKNFGMNNDLIFQVESLWGFLLVIIGLFFMLVSYLFTEARALKQENDLTI